MIRIRIRSLAICFLACLLSFPSYSDDINCDEIEVMSPVQEASCQFRLDESNKNIKDHQAAVEALLNEEQKVLFEKSENLWQQYRDENCKFQSEKYSGTQGGSFFVSCVVEHNKDHLRFLEKEENLRHDN